MTTCFPRLRRLALLGLASLLPLAAPSAAPLDYKQHPVMTTDTLAESTWAGNSVAAATDGLGGADTNPFSTKTYVRKQAIVHFERAGHTDVGGAGWTAPWTNDCSETGAPNPGWPARLTLDYGKPTPVAKLAVYFPRQGNMDGYLPITAPAALLRTVEVLRSADGVTYESAVRIENLPWTSPQVIEIPDPQPAQFYILSIESMSPGNTGVRIYEVETYLDKADPIKTEPIIDPSIVRPLAKRPVAKFKGGKFAEGDWKSEWKLADDHSVAFNFTRGAASLDATMTLLPDAKPADAWSLFGTEKAPTLGGAMESGMAECTLVPEVEGLRLVVKTPLLTEGSARRFVYAKFKVNGAKVRFLPAYLWSAEPVKSAWPGFWLPTCMAAIETPTGTFAVVPNNDQCRIGIDGDEITVCLFPDSGKASALLMPVEGDWFAAYQATVSKLNKFERVRQVAPVTAAAMGINKWIMGDRNWSTAWHTLRSFPADKDFYEDKEFFFIFYGAPYSIPALWQEYRLTGDAKALERVKGTAKFLIESPARVKDGALEGLYYSQLAGTKNDYKLMDQAWNPWATSHTTGAALWGLLYHRAQLAAENETDAALDAAIRESAEALIRMQTAEGGWPFAWRADGTVPSGTFTDSGSIWNVWALHRAGKALDEPAFLAAAEKSKAWWIKSFLETHTYRGYWEDANYREVIYPTREGYEASLAVQAFLEMGDDANALAAAKDMATWVQTAVPYYRTYETSVGGVPEQFTWPSDTYVAPQVGFALSQIARQTKDPFWEPYGTLCKGLPWWIEDSGATFFPLEAAAYLPLHKTELTKSYWVDWNNAQDSSRSIWWLIEEINHRSGGAIAVDCDRLSGSVFGKPGKAWLPSDSPKVHAGEGSQLNWMGYRTAEANVLVIMNDHKSEGFTATVELPADQVQLESLRDGKAKSAPRPAQSGGGFEVKVAADSLLVVRWNIVADAKE